MSPMAEEVAVFARSGVFAAAVGGIYWFLTYEPVGSVLLVGSGLATAFVAFVLWLGARGPRPEPAPTDPEGPFGDERAPLPAPTAAPLGIGLGMAMVVLGLVFTGALVLAGSILVLLASRAWLRAAMTEGATGPD